MKGQLLNLVAAVVVGVLLRFVVNLDPVWWLAWFVPGLLLALSLRTEGFWIRQCVVALATVIGFSANFAYFKSVMPVPAVIGVMVGQTLLWVLMFGIARRVIVAFRAGWTVLALPVVFVAQDTAFAHFTPDGNWGSLAYTQADVLPIAQLASVGGVGGILFVLMLLNAALALAIHYRRKLPGAMAAYGVSVAVFALAAGFGWWRMQAPVAGQEVTFGMASIDDFVAGAQSDSSKAVWEQYDAQVMSLASGGAHIVVLPEKIDVLSSNDADFRKARLRDLAVASKVWLVAGLGVDNGEQKRNEAWWYGPDGKLVTSYLKHFMAPPEREFVAGDAYPVNDIDGVKYGVAICKDMHFASLGRGFGARDAGVMLVPAWDFYRDRFMAMNMTKLRGVESGFSIVRSSRDGLLTISDPYGRVVAAEESTKLPGAALIAKATVGAHVPTVYGRIGDALGWLCLVLLPLLIVAPFVRPMRKEHP